ncbi:MAG TPA: MFS transporter [Anaerolineales bacterium]|nr:MFS transporter [Anaerolineales bacterium]
MEQNTNRPTGMFGFTIVWLGQIVSVLASAMSQFALMIFMFNETGSALAMGMMQVFFITPFLLISPVAGVWVDRYNRKMMMMVSDIAAGIATIAILVLQAMGILEFWHLYGTSIIYGLGMAFQWPAYSAAISTMVPKEQLGRVNGMMSLVEAGPQVIAPILAGALLPVIALTGILFLDIVTFLFAIGALMIVHIPQPPRTEEGAQAQGGILKQAAYGFKYIFARPSLLGLQMIFFFGNLFAGIGFTVLAPMILSRSGSDSLAFGTVQSAGAIAAVIGGVIMSAWGGFKRRVHGVLIGWIVGGIGMAIMGFAGGLPIWITGVALTAIVVPFVNGSNQAIWQSKVAPDLQGRVFSARRLIAWLTNPISPLIGGVLADFVLEPAAQAGTGLPNSMAWLVGTGPGSGMGSLIVLCGLVSMLVGIAGYFVHSIRNAETILPDHDALPRAAEPA